MPVVGATLLCAVGLADAAVHVSSTIAVCGLRLCTRSIQTPDRSVSAERSLSLVSHAVSKRPI